MRVLMSYEISSMSFYLTKDGSMRKSNKSELATELKGMMIKKAPATLPPTNRKRVLIIDFMPYVRKVPIKTLKLNTYSILIDNLWETFTSLSQSCNRIDIIFDVY